MKLIDARKSAQSGQAMVEFLVSMTLVMSVLLLGIVMLGKFNDVRNRTLMGSRYVAWERTVWTDSDSTKNLGSDPATTEGWSNSYGSAALAVSKPDADIRHEVLQRFMVGDNASLTGNDRTLSKLPTAQPAMWADYGGNPLLGSANDVVVSTRVDSDPSSSPTTSALTPFGPPVRTGTGGQYTAQISLPTRTLQSGTLSISMAQDSDVLKRLWPKDGDLPAFSGLTFADTNVLMANTWVPDGTDSAKAAFSPAVPAANV